MSEKTLSGYSPRRTKCSEKISGDFLERISTAKSRVFLSKDSNKLDPVGCQIAAGALLEAAEDDQEVSSAQAVEVEMLLCKEVNLQ